MLGDVQHARQGNRAARRQEQAWRWGSPDSYEALRTYAIGHVGMVAKGFHGFLGPQCPDGEPVLRRDALRISHFIAPLSSYAPVHAFGQKSKRLSVKTPVRAPTSAPSPPKGSQRPPRSTMLSHKPLCAALAALLLLLARGEHRPTCSDRSAPALGRLSPPEPAPGGACEPASAGTSVSRPHMLPRQGHQRQRRPAGRLRTAS